MAKILVVEDEPALSESICNSILFERHVVENTSNGQKSFDLLNCFPLDLIIMDWKLPGMTGVEIIQQFRASGGTTTVLMLTGKDAIRDKAVKHC